MRALYFFAFLIPMAANAAVRDAAHDEKEVRRVEAELCKAFENGDTKTLRAGMDSRFTQVTSRGEVTNLEQNLAEVAKRDPYYDEFRNHDQTVRLYGDTAIVIGITTTKGKTGGEAFDMDFKYTDTYVFRDGRWILVASHATRLKK
jgi:ketosteroid isomerase-like protein